MPSKILTLALMLMASIAREPTGIAKPVAGKGKSVAEALSALDSTLQPIWKLPAGSARTERACAAAEALQAGSADLPGEAPSGCPLDPRAWKRVRDEVSLTVRDLAKACTASDLKSAQKELHHLEGAFQELLDAAKPRTLSPVMANFDIVLRRLWADKRYKRACEYRNQLAKFLAGIPAAPPAGVNADKWKESYQTITDELGEMRGYHCPGSGGDGENVFPSGLERVHESFYELVLLLPPDAK